jgi:hypothetical protein
VVINKDGPVHLLRNLRAKRGHWIMFRVLNQNGSDALGAMLRIDAGGRSYWRQVQPNQGYCSSHDPRLHYGLGHVEKVESIAVYLQKGKEGSFGPADADRVYEVREGRTGVRPLPTGSGARTDK